MLAYGAELPRRAAAAGLAQGEGQCPASPLAERAAGIAGPALELTGQAAQRHYGDAWQRKRQPTLQPSPDFASRAPQGSTAAPS